jgi:hypothetical protein
MAFLVPKTLPNIVQRHTFTKIPSHNFEISGGCGLLGE